MCDKPCQVAHFRIPKDSLIFQHSSCHGWPGSCAIETERGGGGLPPRLSPAFGSGKSCP